MLWSADWWLFVKRQLTGTHTHPVYYKHKHGVRFAIVLTVVKLQIASELFKHPQILAA